MTEKYETDKKETEILFDDDVGTDNPHCKLPKHFFDNLLERARQRKMRTMADMNVPSGSEPGLELMRPWKR